MATANNTIKTRIKIKTDTEANWNISGTNGFIPLLGELIVYTSDATHLFSRLKVGDGQTNITSLPFIDAGSLQGDEHIICKYNNFNSFPQIGSTQCLYLDVSTGQMYHYDTTQGYKPIATVSLNATTSTIKEVTYWGPGRAATAAINNNILQLENGIAPQLLTQNTTVLTGVEIGGNN